MMMNTEVHIQYSSGRKYITHPYTSKRYAHHFAHGMRYQPNVEKVEVQPTSRQA